MSEMDRWPGMVRWRRIGIVLSSRELRLNHKARDQGTALSANPLLSHEKLTRCRWNERSDAEGRHPCCRSTCIVPIAVENHSMRPLPT